MLDRTRISALIPHQGLMCLLECAESWDKRNVRCRAVSHLAPDNPLRRGGALPAVCGVEYGLQAAALHGALLDPPRPEGAPASPRFLASLRDVALRVARLDDPAHGRLIVVATLLLCEARGTIYAFSVASEAGAMLIEGRASVMAPG